MYCVLSENNKQIYYYDLSRKNWEFIIKYVSTSLWNLVKMGVWSNQWGSSWCGTNERWSCI